MIRNEKQDRHSKNQLSGPEAELQNRYERDGWQKISLWRLAEAADALGLDLSIRESGRLESKLSWQLGQRCKRWVSEWT